MLTKTFLQQPKMFLHLVPSVHRSYRESEVTVAGLVSILLLFVLPRAITGVFGQVPSLCTIQKRNTEAVTGPPSD